VSDYKNILVLVTGASSGIGMETALAFAKRNGRLALTGRSPDALIEVRNRILQEGGEAEYFPFDLQDISGIPFLVKEIETHFQSTIDILVNNAAIGVSGFVEEIPIEEHYRSLSVNFLAALAMCHSVIPTLKEKRSGQIINITSGVGKRGLPLLSSLSASKSALNAFTESIRVELAPYDIDVILVSPGQVNTQFDRRLRIYGNRTHGFNATKMSSPSQVAETIVRASIQRRRTVTLSMRTKIAHHLSYWFPRIVDLLLERKMRS